MYNYSTVSIPNEAYKFGSITELELYVNYLDFPLIDLEGVELAAGSQQSSNVKPWGDYPSLSDCEGLCGGGGCELQL